MILDRVPSRIPVFALNDHVIAKDHIERETKPQDCTSRGFVARVTAPLPPAVAQIAHDMVGQ
jgi:hypothetical protein